jgi:hypothetical protein
MVYFIAGDSYSDLSAIRNAGIVDVHLVIHGGGVTPPQQFVTDCNNAKVSPICNCGNDGANGDGGDPQYYTRMAAMGYHAGGGESEKADEMDRCMDNIIFLNYGGEGLNPEDDVFSGVHPAVVHGKGCASYMETYDSATNFWGWNVVGQSMLNAKAHGVKEIGICVGSWMINHSTAQNYIQLAQDMEAHGITCAGIGVWSGYGNNMNSLLNEFGSWYKAWQAVWPPETRTMKERFTGPTPTPTPPTPSGITFASSPATCSINANTLDSFFVGSDKALWHGRQTNGKWTGAFDSLGGNCTSAPSATVRGNGIIDVHVRGSDNGLWQIEWNGTKWSTWFNLGGQIKAGTNPSVISIDGKTVDVFVIGINDALYHKRWDGVNWLGWVEEAIKIQ